MISNADVAQFNNAQENLGNSFMATRMERDRQKQLGVENTQRQEGLDIAKDRNRIADDRYKADDARRSKSAAHIVWKGAFDTQMKLMESGHLSPDKLTESLQKIAAALPKQMQDELADDPLYIAGTSGDLELSPPDEKQPEYREIKDGSGNVIWKGVWAPKGSGAMHPQNTGKPSPYDFDTVRTETTTPATTGTEKVPAHKEGGFFGIGGTQVPTVPAVPATPATRKVVTERVPKFSMGATNAPPQAITAQPSSQNGQSYPKAPTGATEGSKVRNKATGQTGTVKGGFIIPD